MERAELKDLLAGLAENRLYAGRLLVTRDGEEREFLENWVRDEKEPESFPGQLLQEIEKCLRCGDAESKKMPVGTGKNGVMIILNSPRLVHKTEKILFRKEAGELLKKIILSMKLEFEECYITNVIKCESKNPLMKPSSQLGQCDAVLRMEIEHVRPSVAVVFGDIMPLQKIVKESKSMVWFNVEHPITLIKNPELKKGAWNTLKLAMREIRGTGRES